MIGKSTPFQDGFTPSEKWFPAIFRTAAETQRMFPTRSGPQRDNFVFRPWLIATPSRASLDRSAEERTRQQAGAFRRLRQPGCAAMAADEVRHMSAFATERANVRFC
jgi:hypothetical protein